MLASGDCDRGPPPDLRRRPPRLVPASDPSIPPPRPLRTAQARPPRRMTGGLRGARGAGTSRHTHRAPASPGSVVHRGEYRSHRPEYDATAGGGAEPGRPGGAVARGRIGGAAAVGGRPVSARRSIWARTTTRTRASSSSPTAISSRSTAARSTSARGRMRSPRGSVNIPGVVLQGNLAVAVYGYLTSRQVVQRA